MFEALYRNARLRVSELARSLTREQLATPVAGSPEWSAQQVIAHLIGVAADVTSGNVEGAPGERWTRAQIQVRAGRSVDELLAEWNKVGPLLEAGLANRSLGGLPALDIFTHECDLRETLRLGRPPVDDVRIAARAAAKVMAKRFDGPGSLVVRSGDDEWTGGTGQPRTVLTVEPYELLRGLISRRSRRQMRAWQWDSDGNPNELIEKLPVFGARDDDQPLPGVGLA